MNIQKTNGEMVNCELKGNVEPDNDVFHLIIWFKIEQTAWNKTWGLLPNISVSAEVLELPKLVQVNNLQTL